MLDSLTLLTYLLVQPHKKPPVTPKFVISSPAFNDREFIPQKYTCWGKNISLPLKWSGIPKGTVSLALVLVDEDAPRQQWYHWAVFNIPPSLSRLRANMQFSAPTLVANNSWGQQKYSGPCTPNGVQHYSIRLYALDTRLPNNVDHNPINISEVMRQHIIATAQIEGRAKSP